MSKLGVDNIELKDGLDAKYIQIVAFIFLVAMFVTDKIRHDVIPPLEDIWYIALATVAFFGSGFAEKFFSKKLGNSETKVIIKEVEPQQDYDTKDI